MIALSEVTLELGGRRIIDNVSLDFEAGKTYALVGQSGCGKTTLLRLIMRLVKPTAGSLQYDGQPLSEQDILQVRHRIGYVVQDGGLFPHLTARQNVQLQSRHLGESPNSIHERVVKLCQLTRFPDDALDRYPVQMSGGQRQRVGLMRALMQDPDVLLMDEPLGALDPIIRSDLQGDLRQIFRTLGKTVLLVTHDLNEAAYLADAIVLLRDGCVVQRGTIDELVDHPADPFVTRFIQAQRTNSRLAL